MDDSDMSEEDARKAKLESILLSLSIGRMSKWIEKDQIVCKEETLTS